MCNTGSHIDWAKWSFWSVAANCLRRSHLNTVWGSQIYLPRGSHTACSQSSNIWSSNLGTSWSGYHTTWFLPSSCTSSLPGQWRTCNTTTVLSHRAEIPPTLAHKLCLAGDPGPPALHVLSRQATHSYELKRMCQKFLQRRNEIWTTIASVLQVSCKRAQVNSFPQTLHLPYILPLLLLKLTSLSRKRQCR